MNIKKYKTAILTMTLGVILTAIVGCGDDVHPGKFVAMSSNSAIYSEDGINWSEPEEIKSGSSWRSVCYANDMFVAMGNNGYTAYSTDGKSWNAKVKLTTDTWYVCYGNGKFVAVGGQEVAYSTDGKNWTQLPTGSSKLTNSHAMVASICYGNGKFVAVTDNATDTNQIIYSIDGITWYRGEFSTPVNSNLKSVCYGKGRFVAVGDEDSPKIAYSTDGKNWTIPSTTLTINPVSVCYGDGKFIAIDENSNTAFSADGKQWHTGTSLPTHLSSGNGGSIHYQSICYGDGKFIVIGYAYPAPPSCSAILYSTDGNKWNEIEISDVQLKSVTYGLDSDLFGFL